MQLATALLLLTGPIVVSDTDEALRTVGAHLATIIDPAPGAVSVAVGDQGVKLQRGAAEALARSGHEAMPGHVVQPHVETGWRANTTFQWINSPPPPGVPIVLFVPHLVTGAVVQSLLAGPLSDAEGPMTVAAIDADEIALVELLIKHPDLEVITAVPRTGALP